MAYGVVMGLIWSEKILPYSGHVRHIYVQLRAKQTAHLVNKHYENEVTLRQQNWS